MGHPQRPRPEPRQRAIRPGLAPGWPAPRALHLTVQPGEFVAIVGRDAQIDAVVAERPDFLQRWSGFHGGVRRGELQVLAAAASHDRMAWIHPFGDGNGRVARLHTHPVPGHMGSTHGMWSILRGFARSHDAYCAHLAAADAPRAGDLDGRGSLGERGLLETDSSCGKLRFGVPQHALRFHLPRLWLEAEAQA